LWGASLEGWSLRVRDVIWVCGNLRNEKLSSHTIGTEGVLEGCGRKRGKLERGNS